MKEASDKSSANCIIKSRQRTFEMDAWIDNLIAELPPITDEQRRAAVALLASPVRLKQAAAA